MSIYIMSDLGDYVLYDKKLKQYFKQLAFILHLKNK